MENQLTLACKKISFGASKKNKTIKEIVLLTVSLPGVQGQEKPQNHTVKELQTPQILL